MLSTVTSPKRTPGILKRSEGLKGTAMAVRVSGLDWAVVGCSKGNVGFGVRV